MTKEEFVTLTNKNITSLSSDVFDSLEELMNVTLDINEKFNLTAIKNREDFYELMLYDSLVPLKYFNFEDKEVLDVGTGAGFPGLPLAISSKGRFTLLDSTKKKVDHINNYIANLHLNNAYAICYRIEEFGQNKRDMFDYVIARAVAPLNILLELCLPVLSVGGTFIAMKGSNAIEEINLSKNALNKLGAEVISIYEDELPLKKEKRTIIRIIKKNPTPKKYPRLYSEIKKKPL